MDFNFFNLRNARVQEAGSLTGRSQTPAGSDPPGLPDTFNAPPINLKLNCPPTVTTEIVEDTSTVTWEINGLDDDTKCEVIKAQAKCAFEVGYRIGIPTKLCFFLLAKTDGKVDLCCKALSRPNDEDVVFQVTIQKDLNPPPSGISQPITIVGPSMMTLRKSGHWCSPVIRDCLRSRSYGEKRGGGTKTAIIEMGPSGPSETRFHQNQKCSMLLARNESSVHLTVRVVIYKCNMRGGLPFEDAQEASLAKDFGKLLIAKDNYSDLKLQANDGTILSTHKFVLAGTFNCTLHFR